MLCRADLAPVNESSELELVCLDVTLTVTAGWQAKMENNISVQSE